MGDSASALPEKILLSIYELGGYPNFTPLYQRLGYQVIGVHSVRRALSALKKTSPTAIVAEFNFQSDFRDRTSSLESLLAVVQRMPDTKVIVFYERDHDHQLDRLKAVYPVFAALSYPIDAEQLEDALSRAAALKISPTPGVVE